MERCQSKFRWAGLAVLLAVAMTTLSGCTYLRALRPSVLEQAEPPVVRLVNHLPQVDRPNEALVARVYATGGLTHAKVGEDGVMRDEIWARPDQLIWTPAIIVMPTGGDIVLTVHNPGEAKHAALMPSNGGQQLLLLPPHTSGKVRLTLDEPGFYWFGCPVANHFGRNMFGFIFVEGYVPEEARLDRPPQPQPEGD
jgi:PQQ system protein